MEAIEQPARLCSTYRKREVGSSLVTWVEETAEMGALSLSLFPPASILFALDPAGSGATCRPPLRFRRRSCSCWCCSSKLSPFSLASLCSSSTTAAEDAVADEVLARVTFAPEPAPPRQEVEVEDEEARRRFRRCSLWKDSTLGGGEGAEAIARERSRSPTDEVFRRSSLFLNNRAAASRFLQKQRQNNTARILDEAGVYQTRP